MCMTHHCIVLIYFSSLSSKVQSIAKFLYKHGLQILSEPQFLLLQAVAQDEIKWMEKDRSWRNNKLQ